MSCSEDDGSVNPAVKDVEQGEIYVDIHVPDKVCYGTTLFADLHDSLKPRIVEVDMDGEIVWQLKLKDTPAEGSPGWFYKAQRIVLGG